MSIQFTAESLVDGIRVSRSMSCGGCGLAQKADGDELTDDARAAFYAAEGRWSLSIDTPGPRRTDLLKHLREILDAEPADAIKLLRDRRPVATGTLVEIEMFELALNALGATVLRTKEE